MTINIDFTFPKHKATLSQSRPHQQTVSAYLLLREGKAIYTIFVYLVFELQVIQF